MRPAARRRLRAASPSRPRRDGRGGVPRRGGFTLVELLVSVTLVLMMMLMFAEIYSLAQQTISTQKGIADNDQKARILAEVLHRDLETRTFRSVYPFKLEENLGLEPEELPPMVPDVGPDRRTQLLDLRKGYFSISENDPLVDTDDVLQLTIDVGEHGGSGARVYGKASAFTSAAMSPPPQETGPEYDDGILGNESGMSGTAEVAWFLRDGNLFRSVLLVREPYLDPQSAPTPSGSDFTGPFPFWANFDYSAYRWFNTTDMAFEPLFHGPESLLNAPNIDLATPGYFSASGVTLHVPESLGVPHLRFGHEYSLLGRPFEYVAGNFIGRFTVPERASSNFAYPGTGWAPFDGNVASYTGTARRGVDLMLSNVHSFDVEVWDDVVGDFVDLGHERSGPNPYKPGAPVEAGFYHASRRRTPLTQNTLTPVENYHYDHPSVTGDFGNRYDTWHPRMIVTDASGVPRWRNGRAPYRPQRSNPDPNTAAFNAPPPLTPGYPTALDSLSRESRMAFGDNLLDDDGDGFTIYDGDPGDSDAEAPLRAVRIVVRYLDAQSGQMRQTTIEASLLE